MSNATKEEDMRFLASQRERILSQTTLEEDMLSHRRFQSPSRPNESFKQFWVGSNPSPGVRASYMRAYIHWMSRPREGLDDEIYQTYRRCQEQVARGMFDAGWREVDIEAFRYEVDKLVWNSFFPPSQGPGSRASPKWPWPEAPEPLPNPTYGSIFRWLHNNNTVGPMSTQVAESSQRSFSLPERGVRSEPGGRERNQPSPFVKPFRSQDHDWVMGRTDDPIATEQVYEEHLQFLRDDLDTERARAAEAEAQSREHLHLLQQSRQHAREMEIELEEAVGTIGHLMGNVHRCLQHASQAYSDEQP